MPTDFKKLLSARFLFTLGVQMQSVAIGWRMYDLTHDPLSLGLIGLAEAVPALSLALFAGHIVDHGRPLPIYRKTLLVSLLSAVVLFASQLSVLSLHLFGQILALYLSSFLTGAVRSFSQPTIFSIVPRIIPLQDLPRSSAWMSSSMQIARIAGPALGGIIFGWLGTGIAAGTVCLILIMALMVAMSIRLTIDSPNKSVPPFSSLTKNMFSGAAFVFRHPILFPSLTLDMISVLFGGVTALLPVYAAEVLMVGPKGLGVLRAAPAIGATVMGLWLVRHNLRQHAGRSFLLAVTGFGVCILVFGLSRNFYLSLLALALSGAFDSISMVVRTTAVQLASPDSMRGRISAVNSIFIGSSNEIGQFESGIAAKLLGTVNSVVFGGVMCLLTVAAMAKLYPSLRRLNLDELRPS